MALIWARNAARLTGMTLPDALNTLNAWKHVASGEANELLRAQLRSSLLLMRRLLRR